MALPPELVDEILTQLRDDKQTLLNCSLIAKSWAYPSQKLLHDWHLCFIPETYRTWQETASPTRMELLPRVRSLTYRNFDSLHPFRRDHLKSFHRLQQITLRDISLNIQSDIINYLPASQNTLSSLYLANVSIYNTALVDLINHFPNLRDLISINSIFPIHDTLLPHSDHHAGSCVSPRSPQQQLPHYCLASTSWNWGTTNSRSSISMKPHIVGFHPSFPHVERLSRV